MDGGENMDVKTRKESKAVVALVKGRIDTVTAPAFEKIIIEVMAVENTSLLLNCSELEYISSAGLRTMLTISKQLKPKGMAIYFSCLQGNVKDVFNISGFGSIFKIFDSEDDALKSI